MKKTFLLATSAIMLAACSNNDLVSESSDIRDARQTPIEFNVQKQNITKAANLESVNHYNFGVWAWKVQGKNSAPDAEVMNNYLVGYGGDGKGYDHAAATTWADEPGTTDNHLSPWFYEKLGTAEYTSPASGYYQPSQTAYMSNNANQYLRYWDLAYAKTNFYCYAPYKKNTVEGTNDVVFTKDGTSSTMVFNAANSIRDGYEEPQNSSYAAFDRSLSEYMYAGVQATNSAQADVTIPFKHMGAQLFIRFYEDIPGYKVEIIDLNADKGTMKEGLSGSILGGIQATPAIAGSPYTAGTYYTTSGATVTFDANANASFVANWTADATTATNTTPLMFKIPQNGATTASVAPANLTEWNGHNIIPEPAGTGTQNYSYSPTIYYPVAQPTESTTGFTFHVSYRVIAEDNKEVITVHNATVHVPYTGAVKTGGPGATEAESTTDANTLITVWQPNVKYTYTFKITRGSTGTTDPGTVIDPTNPEPSTTKSLYPIVFDAATIEDFTTNYSVYEISKETSY